MDFTVEKYISSFIEGQFPEFYKEHGPVFIQFVKAYYEWMESTGNPVGESRILLEYRDIDTTITSFLEYFQKKYLYGIPFNIIINKRYLLKHILDVYRSKGSIQCYKLLFRLIYDEDVEVYLPSQDMLRVSDGKWNQPKYLEVSYTGDLQHLVGKTIEGVSSRTTAVIENYVRESHKRDIINVLYLSNIKPAGGSFNIGEKIVAKGQTANNIAVDSGATVLGSLDTLVISNGGQDFKVGDILKIAQKDPITQEYVSFGVDGLVKVMDTEKGYGQLYFDLVSGGFGYTSNSNIFVYANTVDTPNPNASFDLFAIADAQRIEYNTDLICDYANLVINSVYGFPAFPNANLSTNVGMCFSYSNNIFGRIASLNNIVTGNGYTRAANVFVRSTQQSNVLPGNISWNSSHLAVASLKNTNAAVTGYSNTDIVTIVNTRANVNITETRDSDPAQTSLLTRVANGYTVTIPANTSGYDSTTNVLKVANANTYFAANDYVLYQVSDSAYDPIEGLQEYAYYYINFVNSTSLSLTTSPLGTNATASITTNSTGGNIVLTVNNNGSVFLNKTANVVISNSSMGNSNGSGAAFYVEFRPYIVGVNTVFDSVYSNNDVMWLKANNFLTSTVEQVMIRSVSNSNFMTLYGAPNNNSTPSAQYRASPAILPANFAPYEPVMYNANGSINGLNEFITAEPSFGNGVIKTVKGMSSGRSYLEGENVVAYLYGAVNTPTIKTPGTGYVNGDVLIFVGGGRTVSSANGFVTTDSNGSVVSTTLLYSGSGYDFPPLVKVKSANGTGATFTASVTEFNTISQVTGRVTKTGIGKEIGRWETTDSFLNDEKRIQGPEFAGYFGDPDPTEYYYQDYSYELRVALTLDKYRDILYDTFHTAGSELFGKFLLRTKVDHPLELLEEKLTFPDTLTCDNVDYSCDNIDVNVGML